MKASVFVASCLMCLCLVGTASAVESFTVNIMRTDGSGDVSPGQSFEYEVTGVLTNNDGNMGLCFFAYDLRCESDDTEPEVIDLSSAVVQSVGDADVEAFEAPMGYSVDFTGTAIGSELVQAGGGQNTIKNDPDLPPNVAFPMGDVVTNVGHGGVVLHAGTFTVPEGTPPGTYTLAIKEGSLFANMITDYDMVEDHYTVEAVDTVIGSDVTFVVPECVDVEAPFIVQGPDAGEGPTSIPCSGYIDPRFDSSNGVDIDLGLTEFTVVFNEEVRDAGSGEGGSVTAAAFSLEEACGGGEAPGIANVNSVMDSGRHVVTVTLDRGITPFEWTVITTNVEDLCNNPIGTSDDDLFKIDIAFLPGDINQSGNSSPIDLTRAQQFQLGTCPDNIACPDCGGAELYYDTDRSGGVSPIDLTRLQQLFLNLGNSTQSWNGANMNTCPRP